VQPGCILVRFDLVRGLRIRGSEALWIRAEPGTPLLAPDNNLHARRWGLAAYPTSAPKSQSEDGLPWTPVATFLRRRAYTNPW
jgi:hypothetical protein